MMSHAYLPLSIAFNHPKCPYCQGVSPSTDGRTECGWCSKDHIPSVVSYREDVLMMFWVTSHE